MRRKESVVQELPDAQRTRLINSVFCGRGSGSQDGTGKESCARTATKSLSKPEGVSEKVASRLVVFLLLVGGVLSRNLPSVLRFKSDRNRMRQEPPSAPACPVLSAPSAPWSREAAKQAPSPAGRPGKSRSVPWCSGCSWPHFF